jgi:hypothetical protein
MNFRRNESRVLLALGAGVVCIAVWKFGKACYALMSRLFS